MPVGKRGLSIRRNFSKRPLSGRIPFAPIHVPTRPSRDWTFHVSSRRENDFSLVIEQGALHLLRRRDLSGCAKNSTIPRFGGPLANAQYLYQSHKTRFIWLIEARIAGERGFSAQNEVYPVFGILLAVGNQLLN